MFEIGDIVRVIKTNVFMHAWGGLEGDAYHCGDKFVYGGIFDKGIMKWHTLYGLNGKEYVCIESYLSNFEIVR